jgi:hypothetical protein
MPEFVKLKTLHGEARVRVNAIAYILPVTTNRCQIEFIGGNGVGLCVEMNIEALMGQLASQIEPVDRR